MVGTMTAKSIAFATGKPFLAVNHLEGHALTVRLTDDVAFPYLLLLVSGGHCQVLIVEGVGHYKRIGTTIDDAVGEAFDKTAKMLGLGYPGGPALEKLAFSGLKTAVRVHLDGFPVPQRTLEMKADLAASFQRAVGETLMDRCKNAIYQFMKEYPAGNTLVLAGGVAANKYLRTRLTELTDKAGMKLVAPPLELCTDNAAMIAWAGLERFRLGQQDALDFKPRPRWPLDPEAPKRPGAGVKA